MASTLYWTVQCVLRLPQKLLNLAKFRHFPASEMQKHLQLGRLIQTGRKKMVDVILLLNFLQQDLERRKKNSKCDRKRRRR